VPRLILTPAAQANLIEIAEYIEGESGHMGVAERFVDQLLVRCEGLAALPGRMGRPRPELLPGLRSVALGSYVIFFRYADAPEADEVFEVVNIIEGHL
jgi:toxin ParE1/3/4